VRALGAVLLKGAAAALAALLTNAAMVHAQGVATTQALAGYGADYSANPPSLSGLTLLVTIPATAHGTGLVIQANCAAGVRVVLDDPPGTITPTIFVLAGGAAAGTEGASLSQMGIPHAGRVRIYSSDAACQVAARAW